MIVIDSPGARFDRVQATLGTLRRVMKRNPQAVIICCPNDPGSNADINFYEQNASALLDCGLDLTRATFVINKIDIKLTDSWKSAEIDERLRHQ